jgi:hypothetical protein
MIEAFLYGSTVHPRRHGPDGYTTYRAYKDWLRDEFTFRCVYCLSRERWYLNGSDSFAVEHSVPQSRAPDLALSYDNLLYSCNRCNSLKTDLEGVLDPCSEPMFQHVAVRPDGTIEAFTILGAELVDAVDLNDPERVRWRKLFLLLARNLNDGTIQPKEVAVSLESYFRFPEHLPDLSDYRPPINTRPAGINETYFAKRSAGKLEPTY